MSQQQTQPNDVGDGNVYGAISFDGGLNSEITPVGLQPNQYRWSYNTVNRGGVLQTRPGLTYLSTIEGYYIQGATQFQPSNSIKSYLVVAVDGRIYFSLPPYTTFQAIPGIQFKNNSPFIIFKTAIKSINQRSDGSLEVIDPIRVLIMQDGANTRAAYWDGSTGRHLNPTPGVNETPLGLWMEWIGDRLWVARDSQIFVSDIGDPLKFSETTYLAEGLPFQLISDCTGLKASHDQKTLFAFTANSTTAFKASIRDRTLWKITEDFQFLLFPEIGCVAGRSIVDQYGLLWWYSAGGLVNFNTALQTYIDAKVVYADRQMARSKGNFSPLLYGICGAAFENYLLMSVPSGDIYNAQTWCLDQAITGGFGENASSAWNSVWTGFRPVEWVSGNFQERPRCFVVSQDLTTYLDSKIRIWEAFTGREDQGNPIECWTESRMHYTDGTPEKPMYAEMYFGEMKGEVEITVFWKGIKGVWHQCMNTTVQATNGPFGTLYLGLITDGSLIQSFKKQSRFLWTEQIPDNPDFNTGIAESNDQDNIDRAFSLLIKWKGQAALIGYKFITAPFPEQKTGKSETQQPDEENQERIVLDTGGSQVLDL